MNAGVVEGVSGHEVEVALELEGLEKSYGKTVAVNGIDLRVERGEFISILGPSGSGKTTVLKLIAGFEQPSRGAIRMGGRDISQMSPAQRGIGMVFQQYALFPHMTVSQNVGYGLKVRGWRRAQRGERVREMLQLVRLGDLADRLPRQLSGGQQQRVALARALAFKPEILLMDEPLGALDRTLRIEMEAELKSIHREVGSTFIYVTHDQNEARSLADRVAILKDGDLLALGTARDLYENPMDPFAAEFFGGRALIPVRVLDVEKDAARVDWSGRILEVPAVGVRRDSDAVLALSPYGFDRVEVPDSISFEAHVTETLYWGHEMRIKAELLGVSMNIQMPLERLGHAPKSGDRMFLRLRGGGAVVLPRA